MVATNFATKLGLHMSNTPGKIPYNPAKLIGHKGNLAKRWYIEFYAYNGKTKKLERRLKYLPATLKIVKDNTIN